jgi:hypothetical protein
LNKQIVKLPLAQIQAGQAEWAGGLLNWKEKINTVMENLDDKLRAGTYQVSCLVTESGDVWLTFYDRLLWGIMRASLV